jgi:hypothetical protein
VNDDTSTVRPSRRLWALARRGTILVTAVAAAGALVAAAPAPSARSTTQGTSQGTSHVDAAAGTALRSPVGAVVRSEVRGVGARNILLPSTRVTARWSRAINTTRKGVVNYAYWRWYAPYTNVPTGWTGSTRWCNPGRASSSSHTATLNSINFVRSLNGLASVGFGPLLNWRAQRSALMMSANTTLSHYPTTSWRCYSAVGDTTAAKSNLALALPDITSGHIVDMYMDDAGAGNEAVGHRRWLLYPYTTRMGNGSTETANALTVVGPTAWWRPNPRWTSWPSSGYFPSPLEPRGRWSLTSGIAGEDFSRAIVRVWHNGRRIYPRKLAVHTGYGMPTVAWQMPWERSRLGTYRVSVVRITRPGVRHFYGHSYTVRVFRPTR